MRYVILLNIYRHLFVVRLPYNEHIVFKINIEYNIWGIVFDIKRRFYDEKLRNDLSFNR